jgi:diazepam-binding inhibitor (GABA receptor modulating acyl-CoA-binding protein)
MISKNQLIQTLFKDASKEVHNLQSKPSDDDLLKLYANYKQAIVGDINIDKPSFYMFKDISKWNAWYKLKGISKVQAQVNYIKIVEELKINYN